MKTLLVPFYDDGEHGDGSDEDDVYAQRGGDVDPFTDKPLIVKRQSGGWLVYFVVEDVDASASACIAKGGKVIVEPRALAGGRFCVIEDPGGATAALYQA